MHGYTISALIGDIATMKPLINDDSDKIEGSGNNIDDDATIAHMHIFRELLVLQHGGQGEGAHGQQ